MIEILLKPQKTALFFLSIVALLTFIHSVFLLYFFLAGKPDIAEYSQWFDLDIEYNIPSFYSACAIFFCALLFFVIAAHKKAKLSYEKLCWLGLGAVFLFLSLDEFFQIHESIGDLVENHVKATGFLYFPWVVPYIAALLVFGLIYLKFLFTLPRRTALLFVLSAFIYLSGALVLDMLGGKEAELHGVYSVTYSILYTIEEFLEMSAIVLLLYTLLSHISKEIGAICIALHIRKNN